MPEEENPISNWRFYTSFISPLTYCLLFIVRRRQISGPVALQLTGALLSATVGVQLANVWLGVHFRWDLDWFAFERWRAAAFAPRPFGVILYLFGALTAHHLIYATGQLAGELRTGRATRATRCAMGLGLAAIAATLLMAGALWSGAFFALRRQAEQHRTTSRELTERYLANWLEAEPDSPHAQRLYREFQTGPDF